MHTDAKKLPKCKGRLDQDWALQPNLGSFSALCRPRSSVPPSISSCLSCCALHALCRLNHLFNTRSRLSATKTDRSLASLGALPPHELFQLQNPGPPPFDQSPFSNMTLSLCPQSWRRKLTHLKPHLDNFTHCQASLISQRARYRQQDPCVGRPNKRACDHSLVIEQEAQIWCEKKPKVCTFRKEQKALIPRSDLHKIEYINRNSPLPLSTPRNSHLCRQSSFIALKQTTQTKL